MNNRPVYISHYESPLGLITLACQDEALIGLWFEGQKYFAKTLPRETIDLEHPILTRTKEWLDVYFSGRKPSILLPLSYGSTPFRELIYDILYTIPYGQTMTYGEIADVAAKIMHRERMSAQAVGGAVGHNPITLIIPCHRVVGSNGSLTGYAGGIDRKVKLLELEHVDMSHFFIPKKGTAL